MSKAQTAAHYIFLNFPSKLGVIAATFIIALVTAIGMDVTKPEPNLAKDYTLRFAGDCDKVERSEKDGKIRVLCYNKK